MTHRDHPTSLRVHPCLLAAAVLLLALAPGAALAIDIEQVHWGFDNKIVRNRFIPLSILIANHDAGTWEGAITLEHRSAVRQVMRTSLTPGTRRWVQFFPCMGNDLQDWKVSWNPGSPGVPAERELDAPAEGTGASVLLDAGGVQSGRPSALPRFPETIFPTSVVALDALRSLVTDHAPRWGGPQQQALLDWVRRGGSLHLGEDDQGNLPVFSDELAAFNSPLPVRRIGAGKVVRHDQRASRLTEADLLASGDLPTLPPTGPVFYGSPDAAINSALRTLTQAHHAWRVIFSLGLLYLLLVGPANWVAARHFNDFRRAIGALLLLVLLFGASFYFIGRRGYGESATTHTLTYARPLDARGYDVTQWSQVFVTRGDTYTLTHDSPHNLYATTLEHETVPGFAQNGMDGRLVTDIPLYSWREFIHRGRMAGPPTFTVERVREAPAGATGVLPTRLRAGPGFPTQPIAVWAVSGRTLVALYPQPDGTFKETSSEDLQNAVSTEMGKAISPAYRGMGPFQPEEENDPIKARDRVMTLYISLAKVIIGRAMDVATNPGWNGNQVAVQSLAPTPAPASPNTATPPDDANSTTQPDEAEETDARADRPAPRRGGFHGRIDVFVLDHSPETFQLSRNAPGLGKEIGYTLYHLTVPEELP
ncbi:MAG: hypothetical protein NTW19_23330 [Planctomycetota bacterium]|nr:hypothetical protein [Planctomycetota bacterium]